MFDKFKEIKGQMKMLKDLQSKLGDVDMSNPQAMLESMGIDVDDLQKQFDSQSESIIDTKVPLRFINESENKNRRWNPCWENFAIERQRTTCFERIWTR